jgi:hypothetical protein
VNKPLFVLDYKPGAVVLTEQQARLLFTDSEIEKGEARGEMSTVGMWQLPVRYRAVCTSNSFDRESFPIGHGPLNVYGKRCLVDIRQAGFEIEGRVTVNGKKHRGFSSSQLFELPSGKLISCAIIHAVDAIND